MASIETKPIDTKQQVLQLERRYWDAMKTHDADTATQLTDDPCVVVGPQGIMEVPKRDIKGMVEDRSFELEAYKLDEQDVKFRAIGDNVAILSYPVHEKMKRNGQTGTIDAFELSVWVRQNGSWVCALHTETLAEPPRGM